MSVRALLAAASVATVAFATAGPAAAATCTVEDIGMMIMRKERTRIDIQPGEGAAVTCASNALRVTFSAPDHVILDCGAVVSAVPPADPSGCQDWYVMSKFRKNRTRLDLIEGQGAAITCLGNALRTEYESDGGVAVYDCGGLKRLAP